MSILVSQLFLFFFELLLCCNLHRCSIHILLSWFLLLELKWFLISINQDLGWKFQQYVVKFCFFESFWSRFWAISRIAESHSKRWILINYDAMIDNICVDFPVSALYNSRWPLWHRQVWLTNHTPPGLRGPTKCYDCNPSDEWKIRTVRSQNNTDSLCRHKYEDISDSHYYNDRKWVQQCNSVWLLRWLSRQIFKLQESIRKILHTNQTHLVYIYEPTFCLIFNIEKIDDRHILRHKHQYQCGEQTS